VSIEEGRPADAERSAREAREEFAQGGQTDSELVANATLVDALLAQGKIVEAQKLLARSGGGLCTEVLRGAHLRQATEIVYKTMSLVDNQVRGKEDLNLRPPGSRTRFWQLLKVVGFCSFQLIDVESLAGGWLRAIESC